MVSFSYFNSPMFQIVSIRFKLLHVIDSAALDPLQLQSVSNCCNLLQNPSSPAVSRTATGTGWCVTPPSAVADGFSATRR
jgi:hypothetical protein